MKNRSFFEKTGEDKKEERHKKRKGKGRKEAKKKRKKRLFKKEAKKHSFSQKIIAKRKNENIICPKRKGTFFRPKSFSLKIKTEKTCLVFFWGERLRKQKCLNIFPFFFLANQKRN